MSIENRIFVEKHDFAGYDNNPLPSIKSSFTPNIFFFLSTSLVILPRNYLLVVLHCIKLNYLENLIKREIVFMGKQCITLTLGTTSCRINGICLNLKILGKPPVTKKGKNYSSLNKELQDLN